MKRVIARWETKGKDFLELYSDGNGYLYDGKGEFGVLGAFIDDQAAIERMTNDWGPNVGPVTVLRADRPSLRRVI